MLFVSLDFPSSIHQSIGGSPSSRAAPCLRNSGRAAAPRGQEVPQAETEGRDPSRRQGRDRIRSVPLQNLFRFVLTGHGACGINMNEPKRNGTCKMCAPDVSVSFPLGRHCSEFTLIVDGSTRASC